MPSQQPLLSNAPTKTSIPTAMPSFSPSSYALVDPSAFPSETPSMFPTISEAPSATETSEKRRRRRKRPLEDRTSAESASLSVMLITTGEDRTIANYEFAKGVFEEPDSPFVYVESKEQNGVLYRRQFVEKFDLDQIPRHAKITKASLHISGASTDAPMQISIHRLLVPWEAATVDSAYFGRGVYSVNDQAMIQPDGSEALITPTATFLGSSQLRLNLDVTVDVRFWVKNPSQNFGWAFLAEEGERGSWGMWGMEGALGPQLTIEYKLGSLSEVEAGI